MGFGLVNRGQSGAVGYFNCGGSKITGSNEDRAPPRFDETMQLPFDDTQAMEALPLKPVLSLPNG